MNSHSLVTKLVYGPRLVTALSKQSALQVSRPTWAALAGVVAGAKVRADYAIRGGDRIDK